MRRKLRFLALTVALLLVSGCGNNRQQENNMESEVNLMEKDMESVTGTEKEILPEETKDSADSAPIVYMTTNISAEGLMAVYEALGVSPEGNIAVKLSAGETGSNYLRTDLIG